MDLYVVIPCFLDKSCTGDVRDILIAAFLFSVSVCRCVCMCVCVEGRNREEVYSGQ